MSTKKQKLASAPEFMLYGSVWDHIITTIILLPCSFQFFVAYAKLLLVKISILIAFLKWILHVLVISFTGKCSLVLYTVCS